MASYLDTSALVKLVVAERGSTALRRWLADADRTPVTSDLARTELVRAVRRAAPDRAEQARLVLESLTVIQLATATYEAAGRLDRVLMRSLDALHLAVALELGDDLASFVTYDDRLAEAVRRHGIHVVDPV